MEIDMNDASNESEPQDMPIEELDVVFSAVDEIQATMVVNALTESGVRAMMQGQHVASFRAENWSDVKVVVRTGDVPAAKQVLAELDLTADVDWDQVDVGEPDE